MSSSSICIAAFSLLLCSSVAIGFHLGGDESGIVMATLLGGVKESKSSENSAEIEDLGRFAVDEHNKKENRLLEFARVVKAKEQVVAGTLHHLTLEAIDAGKKKIFEAKVWVKPWQHFKKLQEFKHAEEAEQSFTPSDLGAKKGADVDEL